MSQTILLHVMFEVCKFSYKDNRAGQVGAVHLWSSQTSSATWWATSSFSPTFEHVERLALLWRSWSSSTLPDPGCTRSAAILWERHVRPKYITLPLNNQILIIYVHILITQQHTPYMYLTIMFLYLHSYFRHRHFTSIQIVYLHLPGLHTPTVTPIHTCTFPF